MKIFLKRFFLIHLVFNLLLMGQQGVFRNMSHDFDNSVSSSLSHQHGHSFGTLLKMAILGQIAHEHEHDHDHDDSFPWSCTHSHDSKTHSHSDLATIKLDLINQRSSLSILNLKKIKFYMRQSNLISSDFKSDIFRPPIFS